MASSYWGTRSHISNTAIICGYILICVALSDSSLKYGLDPELYSFLEMTLSIMAQRIPLFGSLHFHIPKFCLNLPKWLLDSNITTGNTRVESCLLPYLSVKTFELWERLSAKRHKALCPGRKGEKICNSVCVLDFRWQTSKIYPKDTKWINV